MCLSVSLHRLYVSEDDGEADTELPALEDSTKIACTGVVAAIAAALSRAAALASLYSLPIAMLLLSSRALLE